MERITIRDLEGMVSRLNRLTGQIDAAYTRGDDGKLRANVGSYTLSGAYGGWELEQIVNEGGGVTCPIGPGHLPKRELYGKLHAFIAGIAQAAEVPR